MSHTTEEKKMCWWEVWLVDHAAVHFVLEKKKLIVQLFKGSIYSSSKMCFLLDEWIVITPNNSAFNSFVLLSLNTLGAAMWLSNVYVLQRSCCTKHWEDRFYFFVRTVQEGKLSAGEMGNFRDWFLVMKLEVVLVMGSMLGTGLMQAWKTQPALGSGYLCPFTQLFCFANVYN